MDEQIGAAPALDAVDVPDAVGPDLAAGRRYRPSVFGRAARNEFLETIRAGEAPTVAARNVGVAWRTVLRHLESDSFFRMAYEEAQQEVLDEVQAGLIQAGRSGNVPAAIFVLTNRRPDVWRDNKRIEHTGAGGAPIETRTTAILDAAELRKAARDIIEEARVEYETLTTPDIATAS